MTHKITSVLLQIIRLKTLTPDLLNWLCYPEQILPFSQVNFSHSVECSEYPHEKGKLSLRRHSTL